MAILDILIWPHPNLAKVAPPVREITAEHEQLAGDMLETMYGACGIGLAATQVDRMVRLLVIDLNPAPDEEPEEVRDPDFGPFVLINPEICDRDGTLVWDEGCLSVPGETGEVERSESVVVRYTDLQGQSCEMKASQLLAVCLQHEIDHLDGIVFAERVTPERQRAIRLSMKALKAAS
jgi:peptide deformylase